MMLCILSPVHIVYVLNATAIMSLVRCTAHTPTSPSVAAGDAQDPAYARYCMLLSAGHLPQATWITPTHFSRFSPNNQTLLYIQLHAALHAAVSWTPVTRYMHHTNRPPRCHCCCISQHQDSTKHKAT
jgi:hypothetical protein